MSSPATTTFFLVRLFSFSAWSLAYMAWFLILNEELITASNKFTKKKAPMKTIGKKRMKAKSVYDC